MNIKNNDWIKIKKNLEELKFYKEGFADRESQLEASEIQKILDRYADSTQYYRCRKCGHDHYKGLSKQRPMNIYDAHLKYREKRGANDP